MKICEEFNSIQGEGKYVGVPSFFIRTTGCNLRCEWKNKDGTITKCDTPYSSWNPEKGYKFNINESYDKINKNIEHIVITGGEPTLQNDLKDITNMIANKFKVTLETNGTQYISDLNAFISISPKLKSSYPTSSESAYKIHSKNNQFLEPMEQWMETNDYQVKFVVNSKKDLNEILGIQRYLGIPNSKIYLMPQGIIEKQLKKREQFIFNACMKYGFNFSQRLQINLFGDVRGK